MIQIRANGALATLWPSGWVTESPKLLAELKRTPPSKRMTEAEYAAEAAQKLGGFVVCIDTPSSERLVGPEPTKAPKAKK